MFPVSGKGMVIRDKWELPDGKVEIGETPKEYPAREIEEGTS
jgi:ADP-ribose pyrophosphatase YjhB (NUDIX family)